MSTAAAGASVSAVCFGTPKTCVGLLVWEDLLSTCVWMFHRCKLFFFQRLWVENFPPRAISFTSHLVPGERRFLLSHSSGVRSTSVLSLQTLLGHSCSVSEDSSPSQGKNRPGLKVD